GLARGPRVRRARPLPVRRRPQSGEPDPGCDRARPRDPQRRRAARRVRAGAAAVSAPGAARGRRAARAADEPRGGRRDRGQALPIAAGCIAAALLVVRAAVRVVGVPPRLGTLVAVGTAICGNTAIVATAPV